jgi:hypothetical protein
LFYLPDPAAGDAGGRGRHLEFQVSIYLKFGVIPAMYRGKHYLSIADLKLLLGTENDSTAYKRYRAICEAIRPGKRSLTIQEFCRFEEHDFEEIWGILRPGAVFP